MRVNSNILICVTFLYIPFIYASNVCCQRFVAFAQLSISVGIISFLFRFIHHSILSVCELHIVNSIIHLDESRAHKFFSQLHSGAIFYVFEYHQQHFSVHIYVVGRYIYALTRTHVHGRTGLNIDVRLFIPLRTHVQAGVSPLCVCGYVYITNSRTLILIHRVCKGIEATATCSCVRVTVFNWMSSTY